MVMGRSSRRTVLDVLHNMNVSLRKRGRKSGAGRGNGKCQDIK